MELMFEPRSSDSKIKVEVMLLVVSGGDDIAVTFVLTLC